MKNPDKLAPSTVKKILSSIPVNEREKFRKSLEVSGAAFHTEQDRVLRKTVRTIAELHRLQKQYDKLTDAEKAASGASNFFS